MVPLTALRHPGEVRLPVHARNMSVYVAKDTTRSYVFPIDIHRRGGLLVQPSDENQRGFEIRAETPDETRTRYKTAWRKYWRLRLEFPLLIPGWFLFSMLLGGLFRFLGWNQRIAMIFILACIPYMSVVAAQWNFWKCPRCGNEF
jgi:hypothetical protein